MQGMKGINAVVGNEWMKGFNKEPRGVGDRHGGGGSMKERLGWGSNGGIKGSISKSLNI